MKICIEEKFIINFIGFFVGNNSNFMVSRFRCITKEAQRKKIYVSFKIVSVLRCIYLFIVVLHLIFLWPPKATETTNFLKLLLTYFCLFYSSSLLQFNDIISWPRGQWPWAEQNPSSCGERVNIKRFRPISFRAKFTRHNENA